MAPADEPSETFPSIDIAAEPIDALAPGALPEGTYRCPGETYSISRSVHLARLAAHYPLCRNCPARDEQGLLPVSFPVAPILENREEEILSEGGVRAVYLNVMHRTRAVEWGRAIGKALSEGAFGGAASPAGTTSPVVIGHDERVSSPEIAAGLVKGLRQQGLDIADLGFCRKPDLTLAMSSFHGLLAIFITGSGYGPAWTGFDLIGPDGLAWPSTEELRWLSAQSRTGIYAHAKQLGRYSPLLHFEQDQTLQEEFHALRPLTVVCGSENELLFQRLKRLTEHHPCRLIPLSLPAVHRDLSSHTSASLRVLEETVRQEQAHLGCYFAPDGETLTAVDEQGTWLSMQDVTLLLAIELAQEPLTAPSQQPLEICLTTTAWAHWHADFERWGFVSLDGGPSIQTMTKALTSRKCLVGTNGSPQWWLLRKDLAVCDALRVFGTLLRSLSRSDRPCSQQLAAHKAGLPRDLTS